VGQLQQRIVRSYFHVLFVLLINARRKTYIVQTHDFVIMRLTPAASIGVLAGLSFSVLLIGALLIQVRNNRREVGWTAYYHQFTMLTWD
jgi:hypothetical protein